MNRSAAAMWIAAGAAVVVAIGAAAACIPDLPSDQATSLTEGARCGDGIVDLDAGEQCDPGAGVDEGGLGGCTATCRIDCDGGFTWSHNDHCYQLVSQGASALQVAGALCQRANAHVVTFASDEEFRAVADSLDAGLFWVGLSADPTSSPGFTTYRPVNLSLREPGWSRACPGCYAFTADASAPLPVFPSAADGGPTSCIVASSDPQQPWQQFPCAVGVGVRHVLPLPSVVCEREPLGRTSVPCEAGTCFDLVATHGAKRYVYGDRFALPDEAKNDCLAMGGRLIVLQSREEREQLWDELGRMTLDPYGVWIGLSRPPPVPMGFGRPRSPAPVWQWEDNAPVDAYPSEWGSSQPISSGSFAIRAMLWQQLLQPPKEDNTLAHNDQTTPTTQLPYVCEITAGTLAAATARARDAGRD